MLRRVVSAAGARRILRQNHASSGLPIFRCCSTVPSNYNDRDPAPVFFSESVQALLKRVTGMNLEKIFRRRMTEDRPEVPRYEFLTQEELDERMAEARVKAEKLLQMPPVVGVRRPITQVLSRDPAIIGYDKCKYVFTDITQGVSDRKRVVVVRDTDGVLRGASWEERDRMNQIYNPTKGRKIVPPKMFHQDYLKEVLAREKYQFVLDRTCIQYEPDDPEYQRVTATTYEAVEARRHYQALHSTRHYGPLCFYLAWNNKLDNLLIDLIQNEMLSDAKDLVELYQIIHPECQSKGVTVDADKPLDAIKAYMEHDSVRRPQLQLAIQAYQELLHERHAHDAAVKTAHGMA